MKLHSIAVGSGTAVEIVDDGPSQVVTVIPAAITEISQVGHTMMSPAESVEVKGSCVVVGAGGAVVMVKVV